MGIVSILETTTGVAVSSYTYLNEILVEGVKSKQGGGVVFRGRKTQQKSRKKEKNHQTQQHRGEDGGLTVPTEAIQIKKKRWCEEGRTAR